MLFLRCLLLDYICFVLHSAVSSLLSYMSLQMDIACHVALLRSFVLCLFLLFFGTIYWDDVEMPCLVGTLLLNCHPYSPFRGWMKKTDGVNWHMNKKLRNKWTGNNHCAYIAFCSFPILFSSLLLPCVVKSAWSYLGLGLFPPAAMSSLLKFLTFESL